MGILGRVTAALVTAVALSSASVGAADAAPTATDPYSATITTRTVVTTPSPIRVDTRVDIKVRVTANSPNRPTGQVTLRLSPAPNGAGQARSVAAGPADWSRTIDYDGGVERVTGPAFPKTGDWLVTAVFTPDDAEFRGSRDGWAFEVIAGDDGDDDGDDGDDDNGGLLPDTGGPALLWLLLGLALVGGGIAAVVITRRRRTSVATTG